jgi:hypothetical protein
MSVAPDADLALALFPPWASAGDGCVQQTATTIDGVRLTDCDYSADRGDAPTVVLLQGFCSRSRVARQRSVDGRTDAHIYEIA